MTAFIFPGQGSQHAGMGRDFYSHFGEVKKLYDEASLTLGYDVADLSFNGPADELNKTYRTQPCILVASIAACTALRLKGIKPSVVAGHSLGEYSALVTAGSISFVDAVRLTEIRGRIMQDAVPEGRGMMAAILGISRDTVDALCKGVGTGYVSVANYNCPGQIVVSGERNAVEDLIVRAKESGAKRAVPLAVSVPSHCALMEEAGKKFESILKEIKIIDAELPFINNTDAKFISAAEEIRSSLVRQLSRSVLWEDCIRSVKLRGINTYIEVGPGKVLSGLVKRIDEQAAIFNVEDISSLDKAISNL
ncbi:MAG TPA: ACP S-malonyltransferase [Dissulfurispiraceae bacterium]|nr:ACP S-malonyltransferase [Dissulfurispiraceae bacterium]